MVLLTELEGAVSVTDGRQHQKLSFHLVMGRELERRYQHVYLHGEIVEIHPVYKEWQCPQLYNVNGRLAVERK